MTDNKTQQRELAALRFTKQVNAKRARDYAKYIKAAQDACRKALRGLADGHWWLAKEKMPGRPYPDYRLEQNRVQALAHMRIAARLGYKKAQLWLREQGYLVPKPQALSDDGIKGHPGDGGPYGGGRSEWFGDGLAPWHEGVYERRWRQRLVYALWVDGAWTDHRADPRHLWDEYLAGTLARSRQHGLPWRGLACDPSPPHVTYEAPPFQLKAGVAVGGYVEHREPLSTAVKMVHIAKDIRSKDGDYLTFCGYKAKLGAMLRLWNEGLALKVEGDHRPEVCRDCEAMAFTLGEPAAPRAAEVPMKVQEAGMLVPEPAAETDGSECYIGGIVYDNWPTGSRVERFEISDANTIRLMVYSEVDDEETPETVLAATATRGFDNAFSTDWIRLRALRGKSPNGWESRLNFSVLERDAERVVIEGKWEDRYGDGEYPFLAILLRKRPDPGM